MSTMDERDEDGALVAGVVYDEDGYEAGHPACGNCGKPVVEGRCRECRTPADGADVPVLIEWDRSQHGSGWGGYVKGQRLFGIAWKRAEPHWSLGTTLPLGVQEVRHNDIEALKPVAEGWLREYVHCLGAVFPGDPDGPAAVTQQDLAVSLRAVRLARRGWSYEDTAADLMAVLAGGESCEPIGAELEPPPLVELFQRCKAIAKDGWVPNDEVVEIVLDMLTRAGFKL